MRTLEAQHVRAARKAREPLVLASPAINELQEEGAMRVELDDVRFVVHKRAFKAASMCSINSV